MKLRRVLALLVLLTAWPLLAAHAEETRTYAIEVDISNQVVTVYDAQTRAVLRQMLCSSGTNDYTPTGEYAMDSIRPNSDRKPWYRIGGLYVRYASRIDDKVLFHSIPYIRRSLKSINPDEAAKLGVPASHGCIRMRWQDALYIARNCPAGTHVRIYKSGELDEGLRALLLEAGYDSGKGLSYESFLGIATEPGALGRSDKGEEVLRLQKRLTELGMYDGDLSGVYNDATVDAVRTAQYLLNEDMSGSATEALRNQIYADDAPIAMESTLKAGMEGYAVLDLQRHMAALKLYDGEMNGVYDAALAEGVRRFECAYGYEGDGMADPSTRKAAAYEAERLSERFGEAEYSCQWSSDKLWLGRVNAEAGMKLRKDASRVSGVVRELAYGDGLTVIEPGKVWSKVRVDDAVGYVKNSLVDFTEREVGCLRYAAEGSDQAYVIGGSASDYGEGLEFPCEGFESRPEAGDRLPARSELAGYVTVNTGSDADVLNLRAEPDASGAVLDTVPAGKRLRILQRFDDWTKVSYRRQVGYLMNRYLDFWTGPEDVLGDELIEDIGQAAPQPAVVSSAVGTYADLYSAAADDAKILSSISDGSVLEVLERSEGWCRVRWQGAEGYMLEEDITTP